MNQQYANRIKLGLFVMSAIVFFILALYYIGSKRNTFNSTINVSAVFDNVNGLLTGNNVRFNGINIGTVSRVNAISDTTISVEFTIDKDVTKFITMNSIVSIATDGLLGNKLVNLTPGEKNGEQVQEGSVFNALHSIQMEDVQRTLNKTNKNLEFITSDLKHITQKINNSHSLWSLLSDTVMAENVKGIIVNIKTTSNQTAILTGNLKNITTNIMEGKGSLGAFIVDTSLYVKLKQVIVKFEKIGDTTAVISGNISQITKNIKDGKGSIGLFLKDTMLIHNLNKSMENLTDGSKNFNQNMEAAKLSWPFKKYFKKQEKIKIQEK